MIIYNSNKKLIGMDALDLKALGFKNLASLQSESADFADLFVKTPGHVHNFKHVHWIDFVLCAKSAQESKAIIHANDKNFKVTLEVKTIYLNDAPSSEAYMVNLNNLRILSSDEKTEIAGELQTRVAPEAAVIPVELPTNTEDNNDDAIDISFDDDLDTQDFIEEAPVAVVSDPYATAEDEVIDIYEPTEDELAHIGEAEVEEVYEIHEEIAQSSTEESELEEFSLSTDSSEDELLEEDSFTFDPQKTAEALEMPISLIEEFIEDFIAQAKEFKEPLYNAVAQDDMIELQAYSHKLKGVAANLRVNDALEILTKINKAKDFTTSKKDLDSLYRIISKLAGEKVQISKASKEVKPAKIDIEDDELLEIVVDDDEPLEIVDDELDLAILDDDEDEINDEALIISDDFDILDDAMNEIIQENDSKEDDEIVLEVQTPKYNKQVAASEIGIDNDSFNELFDDYINESQNLISSIDDAISNNISEIWREEAIKLKGMSDNMRIDSFKTNLEVLITTKNTNDAKAALSQIQTTIFNISEAKD